MNEKKIESKAIEKIIMERERVLLQLVFEKEPTKESIDFLTNGIDIDTEMLSYMVLLSIIGYKNNFKYFDKELVPRLKGFHRYYQTYKIVGAICLLDIIDKFDNVGIDFVAGYVFSMNAKYCDEYLRFTTAFDFIVHSKDHEKAQSLIEGNKAIRINIISDDRDFVWDRAKTFSYNDRKIKILETNVAVIYNAKKVFNTIYYETKYTKNDTSTKLMWLFDFVCLARQDDFDISMISKLATNEKEEGMIRFLLKLGDAVFPKLISIEEVEKELKSNKKFFKYLYMLYVRRPPSKLRERLYLIKIKIINKWRKHNDD